MTEKKPFGRPSEYDPAMCEVVASMGHEGEGVVEVCAQIGIVKDTFYRWVKEKPDFSDAVSQYRRNSQVWWERVGRMAVIGEVDGFNATAWIFNMKNRFKDDWRDKVEQDLSSSDGTMTPTVIERVIVKPDASE
jgi:hypothetical protein